MDWEPWRPDSQSKPPAPWQQREPRRAAPAYKMRYHGMTHRSVAPQTNVPVVPCNGLPRSNLSEQDPKRTHSEFNGMYTWWWTQIQVHRLHCTQIQAIRWMPNHVMCVVLFTSMWHSQSVGRACSWQEFVSPTTDPSSSRWPCQRSYCWSCQLAGWPEVRTIWTKAIPIHTPWTGQFLKTCIIGMDLYLPSLKIV